MDFLGETDAPYLSTTGKGTDHTPHHIEDDAALVAKARQEPVVGVVAAAKVAPQEPIPSSSVGLDAEDLDGESSNLVARWDTSVLAPPAQRRSPPVAAARLPVLAPPAQRQSPPVDAARLPVLASPAQHQSPPVDAARLPVLALQHNVGALLWLL
ncbi:fibrous sheath cabyr-binding protein-like [Plakobranchus ocellatus]|uniref:Fibrous sheath cabyr-binding protein-like n=1 Tax=Plakobranchus ocellatus TaxID=259542 RepID=A0AAV4AM35_9GAST|nr:fibrous sheath cabyr-binding protein-like [Plakobranchus ocellatus]